jgi:phosphatidylserine decarboxylase
MLPQTGTPPIEAKTPLTPVPITSAQPGGGLGMELELAWGRLRRAWLRRFRPEYVLEMAAKRQGQCAVCPHDVIDSRDLKYYRNVCGFSFRPEDDAFRGRETLGFAHMGTMELLAFSLLFFLLSVALLLLTVVSHPLFVIPLVAVLLVWAEVVYFFRDPHRTIPTDADALLSPADGTVTHIDEVDEPNFAGGRAWRISIFLSVFNVHVNRLPRSGRVRQVQYFPGAFLDARHPECGVRNEQLWVDMDDANTGRPIRLKQVSGAIARRIVCWLRPGEEVKAGERLGMIKFGSRTELCLPADTPLDVLVKVGDTVHGGTTVLARFRSNGPDRG